MANEYDHYLAYPACQTLITEGYEQVIRNIIEDDETYITAEMKKEFFEYIYNYTGSSDLLDYCNIFFYNSAYRLKGKEVSHKIYNVQLGRVCNKGGFRRSLNTTILKKGVASGLSPISDISDEALLDSILIDSSKIGTVKSSKFFDLMTDVEIGDEKLQERPMWTFEGYYDQNVYEGYQAKDLPCILGLPGTTGKSDNYQDIARISFSLRIPKGIVVRKPTSFDAGTMAVWVPGGKSKVHKECETVYGDFGFDEFIHEPVNFKDITSELYSL